MNRLSTLQTKRREGDDEGFTLIELLVVVVILGILIAIAIPTYLNYRKSAADKSAQSDLRNAVTTLEACAVDGAYPTAVGSDGTMTAATVPSCHNKVLPKSENTTFKYAPTGTPVASFIVATQNSGGAPKIYCYNSATGGSVKDVTGTGVTLANATC